MDRNLLIISLGRVVQITIALVSARLFTTYLSKVEVGNIYLITSIVTFFSMAMITPVCMYLWRKLHKWYVERKLLDIFYIFGMYLVVMSVVSVLIVLIINSYLLIGNAIGAVTLSVYVMFTVFFLSLNQTIIQAINMLGHRLAFVILSVMSLAVGLTLSVMIVLLIKSTAVGWLSGQLLSQILVTGIAIYYLIKISNGKLNLQNTKQFCAKDKLKDLATFAVPLGFTSFFLWAQFQSYRLVIERTVGLEFLGMLGLGMAISTNILNAAESIIHQVYLPVFYKEINTQDIQKRAEAWNRMAQLTLPIYISLTLLVASLAPFIVKVLANNKFSQAYLFVIYGAFIELFRMTTNIISAIAHAEMKTKYLMKSYAVGASMAIIGTFIASTLDNYQNVIPMVLLVSGFTTMAIMYIDMKKIMKFKVGIRLIIKSLISSLPFVTAVLFYKYSDNMPVSIAMLLVYGSFFLAIQYYIYSSIPKNEAIIQTHSGIQ